MTFSVDIMTLTQSSLLVRIVSNAQRSAKTYFLRRWRWSDPICRSGAFSGFLQITRPSPISATTGELACFGPQISSGRSVPDTYRGHRGRHRPDRKHPVTQTQWTSAIASWPAGIPASRYAQNVPPQCGRQLLAITSACPRPFEALGSPGYAKNLERASGCRHDQLAHLWP